ncbi:MAG: T9SS type A sorting domain-containing protein [Cyclobacteriaceae bacterium]
MKKLITSFLVLLISIGLHAQSPGGVSSSLRWWLRADVGVFSDNGITAATVDGTAVQQWNDQSTIVNNAQQTTGANKPVFYNSVINSHPTLRFSGDQFLDALAPVGINSTDSWTFFMVFRQTSYTAGGTSDGSGSYLMDRNAVTNNLMSLKIVNTDKFFLQKRNDDNSGIGGPISTTSAGSSYFYVMDYYRQFGTTYGLIFNGKTDVTSGDDSGGLTGPTLQLGRHATASNGGIVGDIAEVIGYNSFPSSTNRQQIESYLALKYGVTLDQSSGGKDYLSSSGTVIYPATTTHATYNNNIAGVGQDNGSSLTQTISQSQNSQSILTVSNPSALSTGNFLMWGDDSPSIANSSNIPSPYVNRLSRVWRAKLTGSVGTVDMSFDLTGLGISLSNVSRFALLTNTSPDLSSATAFTATRTITGNIVKFTGITLTDGLYFSLATDYIPGPGGVSPPTVWLRADMNVYSDAGVTLATNGQTVQQWNNTQGSSTYNVSQSTSGNRPTYFTSSINNNPSINCTASGQSLDCGSMGISSSSSIEVFTAIAPTSYNSSGSVTNGNGSYFIDRTSGTNALFSLKANGTNFGYQKRNDAGSGLGGVVTSSTISSTIQLVNYYRNYNVQYGIGYNGSIENTASDTDGATTLPNIRLGNHASTNVGLVGGIPEFILYTRNLSTTERTRVSSYLALKYGITLSQSVAKDYLSSSGSVIFPSSSSYSSYSSDVAGIGRDDISLLSQINSQSVNSGSMVNISVSSIPSDLTFLIWGSNNGSVTTPNSSDVASPVLVRLSRVWRVANTNGMGAVTVSIDLTNVPGAKSGSDLRLLIDADGVFNSGATAMTGTLTGNIFTVTGVTLSDGNYFTIGSVNLNTPLPVELTQFDLTAKGKSVEVHWSTSSEINSDHFDVMRSKDGNDFEFIGRVKAAGTTHAPHNYSFEDKLPYDGMSFYRLFQVDLDGVINPSKIKSITIDQSATSVNIYPNPTTDGIVNIDLFNWKSEYATISIFDAQGNLVRTVNFNPDSEATLRINSSESMPNGLYIFKINGEISSYTTKVIILK